MLDDELREEEARDPLRRVVDGLHRPAHLRLAREPDHPLPQRLVAQEDEDQQHGAESAANAVKKCEAEDLGLTTFCRYSHTRRRC